MAKQNKETVQKDRKPIPYEVILNAIEDYLTRAYQWREEPYNPDWASSVAEYLHKAETLIELLEIANCGHVGGFDHVGRHRQEDMLEYHNDLKGRFRWLKDVR